MMEDAKLENKPIYIGNMNQLLTCSDISECEEYHPYAIPPDLSLSELHERCSSIGKVNDKEITNVCPCCAQIEAKPIQFFCSSKFMSDDLSQHGSGYLLYLKMLGFTIGLLIFPLLISAVYSMAKYARGNSCQSREEINTNMKEFNTII